MINVPPCMYLEMVLTTSRGKERFLNPVPQENSTSIHAERCDSPHSTTSMRLGPRSASPTSIRRDSSSMDAALAASMPKLLASPTQSTSGLPISKSAEALGPILVPLTFFHSLRKIWYL